MNKIIKILIISDFLISMGWGLIAPVFAVFITQRIKDGNLLVVGIADFIYLFTKSIFQLIFGDYLDIESSDKRNLKWALRGSLILSFTPLLYLFSQYAWQIYLIEGILGISGAMIYPAWQSLFVKHLDTRKKAFSISFHSTAVEISGALAAVVGGIIANYFGFSLLIYLVSVTSLIGSIILFFLIRPISLFEKREFAESKINSLPVVPQKIPEIKGDVLEIRKYNDPVLKDHAKPIKEINDQIRKLAHQMLLTMYKNNGCGLAAPQVGKLLRMIVVDIGEGPLILINPKVLKKSKEKVLAEEGCLSLPGIFLKIKRPKRIEIETFQISDGKKIKIVAEGLLARAILHEIDHLDGILIIDKLIFWKRWLIRKELNKLKKETQELLKHKQKAKLLLRKKRKLKKKLQKELIEGKKHEEAKKETKEGSLKEPIEPEKKDFEGEEIKKETKEESLKEPIKPEKKDFAGVV